MTSLGKESERQLLIKVAVHYKSIEFKKTDAVSWREKLECWDKIASKFSAGSSTHFRTAKQLKNKYESITMKCGISILTIRCT
ncbi:hypothetical protein JTB14_025300 [Gonioctena quinquepunctata]|nr:hypothetical protein JTB14_025300 [Gonioctena quinquepunctata]